jgi:hypothetical protein
MSLAPATSPITAAPAAPMRCVPPATVETAEATTSVPCRSTSLNHDPLSTLFIFHAGPHPGPPPLHYLPRLRFKRSRPSCRALFSFSPYLPSTHGHASVTRRLAFRASHPHRRPSRRGPRCVFDHRHRRFFSPMVRPANPPPFPYLGPPSPLSSSLAAPEASRSRHRPPSGEDNVVHRRTEPPPPPRSRPLASVSPASALVARCPPGGPHELAGNTLLPASHHRPLGDRASAAGPGRQAVAKPAFWPIARGRPLSLAL